MSLENKVLGSLAEQAGSSRRHEFQVADEASGWNLTMTAERRDDLSSLVWELSLRREGPSHDLTAWADAIVARTVALTERLKVYEVDATRNEALLRTTSIERQGHHFYFEFHLRGTGSITVRRFQAAEPGQKREQVAFAVTNETLARLAGNLAGA